MKMDFKPKVLHWFMAVLLVMVSVEACQSDKQGKKVVVTKEMLINHNKKLLGLEAELIQKYLDENKIKMQQSQTGLWYRFIEDSVGNIAQKDQLVHLDYKVSLLNGKVCYSSEQDGVLSIVMGKGDIETGVQEVLFMLSEGDSIEFILPPHLAFGLTGDGDQIPAQSILKYEMRLLKIENLE